MTQSKDTGLLRSPAFRRAFLRVLPRLLTLAALLVAAGHALVGPFASAAQTPPPADSVFRLEASHAENGDLRLG